MSYFVSHGELLEEINKAVDAIFTAVGRMFSEEDKKLAKKLKELESNFLLLINTVGYSPIRKIRKRSENMERNFEIILKELIDHIMDSDDEKAIILADELEQSVEKFKEGKEEMKEKLRQIFKEGMPFIGQEKEKEKKEES